MERALSNLVMSNDLARQVGPAINAGRSILLYGPPGNGKTSVGERIGQIFDTVVYIPYCFEVEGQIIKVFDPAVHKEIIVSAVEQSKGHSIRMEEVRYQMGGLPPPLHRHRRRADAGDAGYRLRSDDEIL